MTYKVTEDYRYAVDQVVCSNHVSVLHHFRDVTTFLGLPVTACDLNQSFKVATLLLTHICQNILTTIVA